MTPEEPARVRLAVVSDRWFKRLINVLRAIHGGVWLGSLDDEHLVKANEYAYQRWIRFKSAEYNRAGLKDWERAAIDTYFPDGGAVLVASAGAGREVIALDDLGYRPTGFDPSPDLVAIGQRLIEEDERSITLIVAPPDQVPDGFEESFDAILVGWGGYVHIRGRSQRISFLRQIRRHVPSGAPILLSFFLRSPSDRHFRILARIARAVRVLRRSKTIDEVGDTVAATFDHYSTWDELEGELQAGGFEVLESTNAPYPHVVCRAV